MTAARVLALVAAVGCSSSPRDAARVATDEPRPAAHAVAPASSVPPAAEQPAPTVERQPIALATDAATLGALAGAGASAEVLLSDANRRVIARAVAADVAQVKRADPKAGVGIRGNAHRLFDVRWLDRGRFELVGLAYRLDRFPMTPGHCGDVHLIYRLAYSAVTAGEEVSSRLPMTLALLLEGDPAGAEASCAAAAAAWMAPAGLAGADLGRWLVGADGPLARVLAARKIVEARTNVQIVRWPSAVRPDLGGHAEYALRAFTPAVDGVLVEAPLENSPDVARLKRDRGARERLLAWVNDPAHRDAIDAGTALLPEEFRARRAVSVSPRGFSRRANRPWRQLFKPSEIDAAGLAGRRHTGSAEALLRRLDDMSCQGCHQARTIAGFHLLGEDGPSTAAGNALEVSTSVPLLADRARREAMIRDLAAGNAVDVSRPPAERPHGDGGGPGSRCGMGDPGFAAWTCAAGLACVAVDAPADDAAVGVCLPEGGSAVGDPCEMGTLAPNTNAHRDRVGAHVARTCSVGVCNGNKVGFPAGMCTASCAALPDQATCGVIALLTPFNNCLARGTPFPRCLAEHVSPAGLRRCSATEPCREDYICARTPGGAGACIPPYFLFQLRVDGHP